MADASRPLSAKTLARRVG
ncbi:hypothetical protein ABZ755_15295 [Streptomyces griseoincarnatus]